MSVPNGAQARACHVPVRKRPIPSRLMEFGPRFPSFWAALVTVGCCLAAGALALLAPERSARLRRGLWIYGGVCFVITLALFALEGIPIPGRER